jgi:hypothetical protein
VSTYTQHIGCSDTLVPMLDEHFVVTDHSTKQLYLMYEKATESQLLTARYSPRPTG